MMHIHIRCIPPKATAQQAKIAMIGGRPRKYDPKNVKAAKSDLLSLLKPHAPQRPIEGPLSLSVVWTYPYRKSEPRKNRGSPIPCDTRPDCDNICKALADTMTRCGYWVDDSQVANLSFSKQWGPDPGIEIFISPCLLTS